MTEVTAEELAARGETCDSILDGALTLIQPRKGYRFSLEAILLARFVRPRAADRVLELGAGCGVVAVMLAALYHPREIVAMELQPRLAAMIARNAAANSAAAVRALCADLRSPRIATLAPAHFDLVVANPPFRALGAGRESPDRGRRLARGGRAAALADFTAAARRYARHGARVAFVFAASRSAELIATMRSHRLEPKRIRFVHPRADAPASVILVESRHGGGVEAAIEPPLILYERPGAYSAEALAMLSHP